MSNRKTTPDLLGEILSGPATADAEPASQPISKPKATKPRKRSPKAAPPQTKTPPVWEYREVVFRDYGGLRAKQVDGRDLSDWKSGPLMLAFVNQLGREGWEMVGVIPQRHRQQLVYFKRLVSPEK